MRNSDIVKEALSNTRRNKTRTGLTILAVFIGAFTLSLTNSIGAGVSTYIDGQLGQIGQGNLMSVSKPADTGSKVDGPPRYEENGSTAQDAALSGIAGAAGFATSILTDEDLEKIAEIKNVLRLEPTIIAQPDFIMGPNGDKFIVTPNIAAAVMTPDLVAGKPFTEGTEEYEIILPDSFVKHLGFNSASEAVGSKVVFGAKDVLKNKYEIEATIVGINNKSLFGDSVSMNRALSSEILRVMKIGIPEEHNTNSYISAILFTPDSITETEVAQLKKDIEAAGFRAQTISDQIGSIQAVIDGIVGVLNAFAIIALIAAGFGIVNTLLMSVQERTREIGLMKAMGMPSRKIYGLFSTEAILIGAIGTALGVLVAVGVGALVNVVLEDTILADLPGLSLSLFTAADIAIVFGIVLAISFLAGTIPSAAAARKNPIDALRYE